MFYRRAIFIEATGNQVCSEVEDDFHHFRVTFTHDDSRIVDIKAQSVRYPWSACGRPSEDHFASLEGLQLKQLRAQLDRTDYFNCCTHMSDIFDLGVNLVLRGDQSRLYEIAVAVLPGGAAESAVISRNGKEQLAVQISKGKITLPDGLASVTIDQLNAWAKQRYPKETRFDNNIELISVLQRAIYVSFGKGYDWQDRETADQMMLPPVCFTMATQRASQATRMHGSDRDYSAIPDMLLGGRVKELREQLLAKSG